MVLTRQAGDNHDLSRALEERGAIVIDAPLIRVTDLDLTPLIARLRAPAAYAWIVFTSRRAVEATSRAILQATGTSALTPSIPACAVGPATAAVARQAGWEVVIVPDRADAQALATSMTARLPIAEQCVLFPCALGVSDSLPSMLRSHGARVDAVPCYDTVADATGQQLLRDVMTSRCVDVVALASGSAVRAFVDGVGMALARSVRIATIGPQTTRVARELGLSVAAECKTATVPAFAETIGRLLCGDSHA